jgi:hypothetical protein
MPNDVDTVAALTVGIPDNARPPSWLEGGLMRSELERYFQEIL